MSRAYIRNAIEVNLKHLENTSEESGQENRYLQRKKQILYMLLLDKNFEASSTQYVNVRGDKSPYDGNLFYWSVKMGRNPKMPTSKADAHTCVRQRYHVGGCL